MKIALLMHSAALLLLWSLAEAATLKIAHASTSGVAARIMALVQDRETFEAHSHAQIANWCNATLPAQGSRRSGLQQLLRQTQDASTSNAGPEASSGASLAQLETQAVALGGELEQQRLQVQTSESTKRKDVLSSQLYLEDATKDVQALQAAFDHLGGIRAPGNAGAIAAAKLLAQAKETKRKAEQQVAFLQSHSSIGASANLSTLAGQYQNKKADIVSSLHQFFTMQRSLDVLVEALEDESGYLADLQSICGAEALMHKRVESDVLPMLRSTPALVATESAAPSLARALKHIVRDPVRKVVAPAAPKVAEAAAPKPAAVKPAVVVAPKPAAVKPAVVAKPKAVAAIKPMAKKAVSAPKPVSQKLKAVTVPKLVTHQKVAPKPVSQKLKAVTVPKLVTHQKLAPKPVSQKLKAVTVPKLVTHQKLKTGAKVKTTPAVHKKSNSKAHKQAPIVQVAKAAKAPKKLKLKKVKAAAPTISPAQDADDTFDNSAPVAAAPATPTQAPVLAKHGATIALKKVKAAAPTIAPAEDADDTSDTSAPVAAAPAKPTQAPVLAKHGATIALKKVAAPRSAAKHAKKAVTEAPVAPATTTWKPKAPPPPAKVKDPFADDDDEASADTAAAPPPPVFKAKTSAKHKAKLAAKVTPPPAKTEAPATESVDDAADAAPPPPPPAAKAPVKLQAKKVAKAPPAPAKIEAPPAPAKADDDVADDATFDNSAAPPPPPVVKAKGSVKHQAKKVVKAAPPPPDTPKAVDEFADDDDNDHVALAAPAHVKKPRVAPRPPAPKQTDEFADDDETPPAPQTQTHLEDAIKLKKTKKAAPPKNEFMDGVYDSAAGNLPTAYAAWKPDDGNAAPAAVATTAPKPANGADAKNAMIAMLGTGGEAADDVMLEATPIAAPPPAARAPLPTSAPIATPAKTDAAASESDSDAVNAMASVVKPAKAKADDVVTSDDAVDSMTQAVATPAPKPAPVESVDAVVEAPAPKPVEKKALDVKGPTVDAMKEQLEDGDGDQSTSELQMPKHTAHKASPKPAFMDASVPVQYQAFTPADQSGAEAKKKAAMAEMEAGLDDDDDAPPTPAPKKKHHKRHHAPAPPPPAPPPRPKPSADGVVYDDDDLPTHHASVSEGLEGGWQALLDKKKASAPAKVDNDVTIMQSLYSKDGGLPNQYKAWTPDDMPKPAAPPPPPQAQAQSSDDGSDDGKPMDLEAAAKAFAKNPDTAFDFLQMESAASDAVSELIHRAAAPASFRSGAIFLEASSVSVDSSRKAVASTVLDQYSEVLKSKPLRQLAKAKLSPLKLQALYQQLRKVDPLAGSGIILLQGKQARAEQMCKYFQDHVQVATPVQKAVSLLEAASNELAQSVSRRAALLEEIDARTQLSKTMEQDVSSLTALAGVAKQGEDASALEKMEKQLTGVAAASFGTSAGELKGAHAEVKDLLDLALSKRVAALQVQRKKLVALQGSIKEADADLAQKKDHASTSQVAMEEARHKLAGITSSCDTTLNALAHRRHAGHMEAHAIEVALEVLGSQ